ncbi:hypothetical protein Tco_0748804 [Tanacetum coccineum]|uniref:Uncharacterized protein n=1 Tax=Tanacetum coccineum TaxID=301880 RepID=A0ABQ4YZL9_9ASTR
MMEAYTERMNQQREQEALLAAQRERELLAQKQAAQEKEEPPQNSVFRQLIEEICGTKASAEEKQKLEDTMLELLEYCRQKELYCMHNDVEDLIESALNSKLLSIKSKSQHLVQEKQEIKNIAEPAAKRRTHITSCLRNFKVIHKESIIPLNNMPQISPVNAITHNLPTEEPEYSLSMGDEHLDTIPETESDELIKSSVENLVPIPSESKDISDGECELPLCDDSLETQFTTFSNPLFDSNDDFSSSDDESFSEEDVPIEEFKIYSNPLFDLDEQIISSEESSVSNEVLDEINSIPPGMNDCFNAESDLIESLLNRDTSIDSFHKIDSLLDEFAGKLTLLKPISPEIDDSDFDPEGEIRLIERLLYDNSSPRPPEDLSIESFSPSHIPVEDSDSFMEEIDIFLASDDSTPPGVESDYDLEGDILFLEELLNDDLVPLSKYNHFTFDVEPDTTVKNDFDELNEDECFDPGGGEIDEDDDYFPFTFVIQVFLPYLTYPEDSSLFLSCGNEDTIFDPDISAYSFYSLEPVACENPMTIFPFFCFCPKDKGIRGESS